MTLEQAIDLEIIRYVHACDMAGLWANDEWMGYTSCPVCYQTWQRHFLRKARVHFKTLQRLRRTL